MTGIRGPAAPAPVADDDVRAAARRFARWSAAEVAGLTAIALAAALVAAPKSGPACAAGCVGYPYTDIARFYPQDYLWMPVASLAVLAYFVLTVALIPLAPPARRVPAVVASGVALLCAGVLAVTYFVQVAVVQPSLVRGETEGIALLTQYNPHGIFIALEDVGYLLMALSFLFLAPSVTGGRGARVVRWTLRVAGGLTTAAFVVLSVLFGHDLEYRFEILAITLCWVALIVVGAVLAVAPGRPGARRL